MSRLLLNNYPLHLEPDMKTQVYYQLIFSLNMSIYMHYYVLVTSYSWSHDMHHILKHFSTYKRIRINNRTRICNKVVCYLNSLRKFRESFSNSMKFISVRVAITSCAPRVFDLRIKVYLTFSLLLKIVQPFLFWSKVLWKITIGK